MCWRRQRGGVRCKVEKKPAISEAFDIDDNEHEVISKENCPVRFC